jgi:hypothetical protein
MNTMSNYRLQKLRNEGRTSLCNPDQRMAKFYRRVDQGFWIALSIVIASVVITGLHHQGLV